MRSIDIKIVFWDVKEKGVYSLEIDGKVCIEVKKGELEEVVKEIKKYLRLRFKEELR